MFTRFLNVFSSVLPAFPEGNMTAPVMVQRLLVLLLALLCTGIGADQTDHNRNCHVEHIKTVLRKSVFSGEKIIKN